MSQQFFGNLGSVTLQSTPKPGHHHVSAKGSDEGQSSAGETLDESGEQQSEDSGVCVLTASVSCSPVSAADDAAHLSPKNSRIDVIGKRAQDLIESINERRAMDQHVMDGFEEKLIKKVREMCEQVREQMFQYYEQQSQGMQASITELSEVLERSSQLSLELQEASQTLEVVNKGLRQNTEL